MRGIPYPGGAPTSRKTTSPNKPPAAPRPRGGRPRGRPRPGPPVPRPEARPGRANAVDPTGLNVLLITLDTTRADRLGCYGYAPARTPRLDALAAEGVRFARA
ncbi:MAG: sulfatase-like hydrolase/transferase [Candidatus Moduliflexus flocculans]|nr:sulfatase-like hydrolase/transferase [Candidatus Moduliflexus flocculans]